MFLSRAPNFRKPILITLALAFLLSTSTHAKIESSQSVDDDTCFAHVAGTDYSSSDEMALQNAVDAASNGALIKVAGTCAGTHSDGRNNYYTVYIAKTLTIQGGYPVGNWTDPPNPALNPTVLNANQEGQVIFATGDHTLTTITLNGLTITGGLKDNGGGIYNRTKMTVVDSMVSANTSSVHGGGIFNDSGTLTISNSTFDDNTAGDKGGAIYSTGSLKITNSTLSGNQANGLSGGGGALVIAGSSAFVEYSTFVGNSAPFVTGYDGIWVDAGILTISSSILGSNGFENCRKSAGATLVSGGYNLSSDEFCPFGQEGDLNATNPLLGPLADHGGPTKTHLLLPFSPAIDSIPNNINNCGVTIDLDQRGVARPVEDYCDRGAVELDTNYAPVANPDTYSLSEDNTLTILPPGVLDNDVDRDWDDNLTAELDTIPAHGSINLNSDGSFEYIPEADFCGPDTFTYFANDGSLTSKSATVTLDVTCINDVPKAYAGVDRTVNEGTEIVLFGNYFDPETNLNPQIFWDFGDGTGATGSLMPVHIYLDDGSYPVQLTVIDDEAAEGSDIALVTVKNVAPIVVSPVNKTVVIGEQVSFLVGYHDPGILDTHTASIDWRDGTIEPITVDSILKKISGNHIYTKAGVYEVRITMTDNGGAQTIITFTVTAGERLDNWIYLPVVLDNDQ